MVCCALILLICGIFGGLKAYVPACQPLIPTVIKFSQQNKKSKDFIPVSIETRDGFACIDGIDAFEQAVVQSSHARLVVVFFFAQRDLLSQKMWQTLRPLVREIGFGKDKKADFVAVDIFQGSGADSENQNYQIAVRCMESVGMPSMQLPIMVFFKDGLMCSSPRAILVGQVKPSSVKKLVKSLTQGNKISKKSLN